MERCGPGEPATLACLPGRTTARQTPQRHEGSATRKSSAARLFTAIGATDDAALGAADCLGVKGPCPDGDGARRISPGFLLGIVPIKCCDLPPSSGKSLVG